MNTKISLTAIFRLMVLCCVMASGLHTTTAKALANGIHTFADSSALSSGYWVKIALDGTDDGIYQITYSQLAEMGFSDPGRVGVYGFGGHMLDEAFSTPHHDDLPEVAVWHDSQRRRILFYGRGLLTWSYVNANIRFMHRQHPYATQAYYFLHEKDGAAARVMDSIASGTPDPDIPVVTTYHEHLLHETEEVNIGRTGRELYGESFVYTQAWKFSFPELNAGSVLASINVVASSSGPTQWNASVNGEELGSATIRANTGSYVNGIEANITRTFDNTERQPIQVSLSMRPEGATPTRAHLNYIRLQGERDIALQGEAFRLFRHTDAISRLLCYQVSAESVADLQVWDVTSPVDVKLQQTTDHRFVPAEKGLREYALVNTSSNAFPGVKVVGRVANQNLHQLPQTDMVIVVPVGLTAVAETLADYRRTHDSLHVTLVSPEQVYNEFSSGTPDATAIRLFLKMFYDRGKQRPADRQLKYLLLFGDGYYNNREIADSKFYLPVYESDASLVETSSCVCDDYFGFLDDNEGGRVDANQRYVISNDVVDIGIGRLPVHSVTEAEQVVSKIIRYSDNTHYGSWKNKLCFVGDDDKISDASTDSPNCHISHCDSVAAVLQRAGHNGFVYQKIYLPAYNQTTTASGTDYPDAKREFLEALQQGALIVNYAGHGSNTAITNENLVTTASAATLHMKNLPVWITATCDFSRFDDDETSCGEMLLLNPNGGAIALFSTSRVVYAEPNLRIHLAFARNLFKRHSDGTRYRLGDIMKAGKNDLRGDYNKLNFCLLGDPSMTMTYPEHELELTAINGRSLVQSTQYNDVPNFSLPTLQRVTMAGRVLKVGTNETDTTFHGLIYPTIFDAQETITADKGLHQDPVFEFETRTKQVFSGRDMIRSGEFEFNFVVPQDVSYSLSPGLVNLYACSEDGAEGQGYFDRITMEAGAYGQVTDTLGPEITQLFLNVPTFKSGDMVGSTPYFFAEVKDSTGFNATGNSIGHDITLSIRSLSNPLLAGTQHNLNHYFTTFTGDASRGNVRFSMPALEDGTYEATFRVWDVYNNVSSRTFRFVVNRTLAPEQVLVQAYPSPACQGEPITFRVMHNRPESEATLQIQVFTETGVKVWEQTVTSSSAEIVYTTDMEKPYHTHSGMTSDESSLFLGSSVVSWNQKGLSGNTLAPGMYIYRVYVSSLGSAAASSSRLLLITGDNKTH